VGLFFQMILMGFRWLMRQYKKCHSSGLARKTSKAQFPYFILQLSSILLTLNSDFRMDKPEKRQKTMEEAAFKALETDVVSNFNFPFFL